MANQAYQSTWWKHRTKKIQDLIDTSPVELDHRFRSETHQDEDNELFLAIEQDLLEERHSAEVCHTDIYFGGASGPTRPWISTKHTTSFTINLCYY